MTQFKTDVYINGSYYDSYWRDGVSEEEVEQLILDEELVIEFETEEA